MKSLWTCALVILGASLFLAASPHAGRGPVQDLGEPPQPLASGGQRPATGAAQRLVGAWELATRSVRQSDGTLLADPVLGEQPRGRLFYDASGVMMLQLMRLGRRAAFDKPTEPDAANPRVILGYDAYFGRYTIDERAGTITHHVEGSLFPDDLGKDFVRGFTLDGDTLTLRFTSSAGRDGVTRTLVFHRLRDK
jgi:hypothetical protein